LCETYIAAATIVRQQHVPAIIHVTEVTQPQGHSTSGSHERYKSKERLEWEKEFDCVRKMREWMINQGVALPEVLDNIEKEAKAAAKNAKDIAWHTFEEDTKKSQNSLLGILSIGAAENLDIAAIKEHLEKTINPERLDSVRAAKK